MLIKDACSLIKFGLLLSFTKEEIKDGLQDDLNIFAYMQISSRVFFFQVMVQGNVHVFNSITELDDIIALAFPKIESIIAGGTSDERPSSSRLCLRLSVYSSGR